MGKTPIEWTDMAWNPTRGCSRVSEGCRNCYAERMAARFSGTTPNHRRGEFHQHGEDRGKKGTGPYAGFAVWKQSGPSWTGKVELIESKLEEPLHWRKPRRIFVNSMSDLFHEALPFEDILRIYRVIQRAHWHTYQILTKRERRLYEFTQWMAGQDDISIAEWPRQVHLGVSVENQETADERIPWLLKTPAAVRFVSYEPALGPVEFDFDWLAPRCEHCGRHADRYSRCCKYYDCGGPLARTEHLDQIIFGGESGPGARPMHPDWARSGRDQCQAAGVSFFMKQMLVNGKKIPFAEFPKELQVREMPNAR